MDYELPIRDDGRTVTYRLVELPIQSDDPYADNVQLGAKRGGRGRSPMGGTEPFHALDLRSVAA